ncbi:MAG: tRNA pseudouridine(38-40) synthase TruA [Geobacteraceae bacterium]|nr:tRNA pseudouridine(38-40) synthase TruA [Geobacteraceae bacterium]
MRTIKLIIEYDGTQYVGWQIQPNGLAVQEVLEVALSGMLKEKVRLVSSGRTDAGVHARGMVASFRTDRSIPVKAFCEGLNAHLPPDIAIREAIEVSPEFNPRRDAVAKHYRYTIYNSPRRSPLNRQYVWRLGDRLDCEAMQRAATLFLGEKDFAAFRASNCAAKTTVRRIDSLDVSRRDDMIVFDVRGSGFLKNMVRIMVGTLVEVGRGSMNSDDIVSLFLDRDRKKAGITAPPQGLCLLEVYY